ncbi:hypothetical protein M0802_009999 [Mischocyttarus mexicanus]|nr:hypothetical protein M0802_009999 [Mischocyttarus mexicanus]
MKTFVIIFFFAFTAYISASAIPDYDGPVYDFAPLGDNQISTDDEVAPMRDRRFTCDFFSFQSQWVTPNHAACATKCLFKGRRGGTCRGGRCVCRHG